MKCWIPPLLLTVLGMTLAAIFLTSEPDNSHGFAHAQITEMHQAGNGADRLGSVLILAWLFGTVMIAFFVSLLALAILPGNRQSLWLLLLGTLLYETAFSLLVLEYRHFVAVPEAATFWGPFPTATAWVLFGVWLVPYVFILFYVVFFDRWILPAAHRDRFEELLRNRPPGLLKK